MEKLYSSKGISKSALIGKTVSIALFVVITISLFVFSESKYEVTQGFGYGTYTSERDRFSYEEKQNLILLGFIALVFAGVDAVVLSLQLRSWTEIYSDHIKANSMGKMINCKISEITEVSIVLGNVQVTDPTGKKTLYVNSPLTAQRVIEEQMEQRIK